MECGDTAVKLQQQPTGTSGQNAGVADMVLDDEYVPPPSASLDMASPQRVTVASKSSSEGKQVDAACRPTTTIAARAIKPTVNNNNMIVSNNGSNNKYRNGASGRRADKKQYLLVENMDLVERMVFNSVRRKLAENPIVAERVVSIIEQTNKLSAHMVDYLISGFAADHDLRLDSQGKQSPTGNYDVYAEYIKTWPKKLCDPTSRGIRTIIEFKGRPIEAPLTQWKCLLWFCSTPAYTFGEENVELIRADLNRKKKRGGAKTCSLLKNEDSTMAVSTPSAAAVDSSAASSKGRGRGRVRQLQSLVKIVKCPQIVSFEGDCAITPTPTSSWTRSTSGFVSSPSGSSSAMDLDSLV